MPLNTVLVFLSSLSFLATGQDASLDTQVVAPILTSAQTSNGAPAPQDRVSVRFREAKPSEVFAWLQDHGVDFVASSDEFRAGTTITVNIQNGSMNTVLNAIARALGGHWERENGVRVFRRGNSGDFGPEMSSTPWGPMPNGLNPDQWSKQFGPDFEKKMQGQFGPDFQKKMEEQGKIFEKQFGPDFEKKMQGQFGPDFQKKMEEQGKIFEKSFGPDFEKKMQGQFGPDFQKKMEEQGKIFEKSFGPDFEARIQKEVESAAKSGNKVQLDPEMRVKIQHEVEQAMRDAQRAIQEAMKAQADSGQMLKGFKFDSKSLDGLKSLGEFKMNGDGKAWIGSKGKSGVEINEETFQKLLHGLTSDQRDKQSKRGYIWWDDLTPDQQQTLGKRPSGHFELKYKSGDNEIAIRGN
jgi:hypothetical protein